MNIIFSGKRIENLEGKYAEPKYFDGSFEDCDVVYTDDENIIAIAKERGLTVRSIKAVVKLQKTEDETPAETTEEPKTRGRRPNKDTN